MTVTPQGQIHLCDCLLEEDSLNQLNFSNQTAQLNYFNSTIVQSFNQDDYTYIKKDNMVKVGANIDSIIHANYLYYRNDGFPNAKLYFCFITNMEYVNENCTAITFETDSFQTYQFDIHYEQTFIEREHTDNDTIGLHTVPENVELGDYVATEQSTDGYINQGYCYMLRSSIPADPQDDSNYDLAVNYGGVPGAGMCYVLTSVASLVQLVHGFDSNGRSDAIIDVYMLPKAFVHVTDDFLSPYYHGQSLPTGHIIDKTMISDLNGYTPRNNKLFTFPYCFLEVTNNSGVSNVYKYENFINHNIQFSMRCMPVPGGSCKLSPMNYTIGATGNEEEGMIAGKFPTLSWSRDEFTNWLTQNGVNLGLGIASSLATTIGGIGLMATGGGAVAGGSAVASGLGGVANALGQIYEHSLVPRSSCGNTNGGDINTGGNSNCFYFYKKCIRAEYAKIIDDYFTMYGYKVNSVKIPNINSRQNWNFIKTVNCNITGSIPQQDMQKIKNMFNNGVTIWHNPSTMLEYNHPNPIV